MAKQQARWQPRDHFNAAKLLALVERLEAEGRLPSLARLHEVIRETRREWEPEPARGRRRERCLNPA